ncbi:copper chaperone PCu(A)C [Jiella mangrovi]|uniref:Copper chaperone PCu(A)C n=1 Tax=Jiella mangrovi TaxID=2821407 RepID=A0ABS4BGL1_9HYPH|nr:copper chaperone PCu(A)C [Jiella mangrovi]MBP0615682.1 copper chaperone PCu(A)C [Jiella mangrovi]
MRFIPTALAAASLVAAVSGASAHSYKVGDLEIAHPWSRATLPNAPVAGGYMTITNTGKSADRLIGGSTPAAERVEIHEMTMDGDVMKMRPVEGGLEIPAGETITLKPGGYHLMLTKPAGRLKEGDRVPLTLRFEKAGEVKVELAVDKPNAMGPGGATGVDHEAHGAMKMK